MGYRAAQGNFTKGEISPEAEARFELPVYQAAVRKATNVKVQRTGGLKKRMGTRFVAEALSSLSHLIPFQFSDTQAYALEFAQALMRPLALGGAILETGLKITAITKAANAKITAAYHGYSVGDQVYLSSASPSTFGMYEILDRFLTVQTVPDANNFTVNFNSTNAHSFGSDTGQVNTVPPPPPPPPPAVPPPAPSPPPPTTGTGSGGGYDSGGGWTGPCVTDDSLILFPDGAEKVAGDVRSGMGIYTFDEFTLEPVIASVTAVSYAWEPVYSLRGWPSATALHRFGLPLWLMRRLPPSLRWFRAKWFGRLVGVRRVCKFTTTAGTYLARHPAPGSKWRLCHNVKPIT